MRRPRHLISYLLFFVLIQAITLSTLSLFKGQELDSFITERQTAIKGQYSLVTHLYRLRARMVFGKNLTTPEIVTLMEKASVAAAEERNRLRQELYHKLLPLYRHLQENGF
jgi:hypothetical protein